MKNEKIAHGMSKTINQNSAMAFFLSNSTALAVAVTANCLHFVPFLFTLYWASVSFLFDTAPCVIFIRCGRFKPTYAHTATHDHTRPHTHSIVFVSVGTLTAPTLSVLALFYTYAYTLPLTSFLYFFFLPVNRFIVRAHPLNKYLLFIHIPLIFHICRFIFIRTQPFIITYRYESVWYAAVVNLAMHAWMLLPLLPLLPSLPLPVPYRNESIMVNQTSDSDQCYTLCYSQNQLPYPYEECTTNAKTQKLTRHFYATLSLPIFSNLSAWRNNDITFFPLQISIYI